MDGIVAAQELISDCFRNKKRDGILMKLDFAKAYYMLDCNFIFEVLAARKFGSKRIQWMHLCLKGGKSHILVNGNLGWVIHSKRGLRQGDPLSPLLLVPGFQLQIPLPGC